MSIPITTVPAVLAYLQTAIAAQPALQADGVQLYVGIPPTTGGGPMVVLAVELEREVPKHAMVSDGQAHAFRETYEITYDCWAGYGGTDGALTAMQTCYGLLAAVETAVRTDLSLGGLVVSAYPGESTHELTKGDDGYGCTVTSRIQITAEL